MIRGAIAFGLIQNLSIDNFGRWVPNDNKMSTKKYDIIPEVEVVQSSVLYLVILTTVVIGGLTPPIQKCLLTPAKKREQIIHLHQEKNLPAFGQVHGNDEGGDPAGMGGDQFGEQETIDALNEDNSNLKQQFLQKHIISKIQNDTPTETTAQSPVVQEKPQSLNFSANHHSNSSKTEEDMSVTHYGKF